MIVSAAHNLSTTYSTTTTGREWPHAVRTAASTYTTAATPRGLSTLRVLRRKREVTVGTRKLCGRLLGRTRGLAVCWPRVDTTAAFMFGRNSEPTNGKELRDCHTTTVPVAPKGPLVNCCAWGPWECGLTLASGSAEGAVSVAACDEKDFGVACKLPRAHPEGVTALSWGPVVYSCAGDSEGGSVKVQDLKLVTGGCDQRVNVWIYKDKKLILEGSWGHNDWVRAVSYTHLTLPTNREV
eukprot:TRINITY_DN13780_c0_g2_i2.p1 TRINITY_DN13780_c0_g2~~TRINITY_DN13780_c0_g2_i2.p1  ORF type:complete len:239 (+),score=1.54 TRINITY_DN13780_c0_g2_i2:86-802(+)